MENCLFCKIIKGDIPCHKIYENETTLAFLDINPVSEGHALVIPKTHHEDIQDVKTDVLLDIIKTTKKISQILKEKLNATGINIVNASGKDAQQSVFHIHFHVVPRYKEDGLNMWFHGTKKEKTNLEEIKNKILG